jgi:hypothetical protein
MSKPTEKSCEERKEKPSEVACEKSPHSDQASDNSNPKLAYTPINITDEEWIAATQACCGIDFLAKDSLKEKDKQQQPE